MTPHNEANKGDIAKVVLMPGDPNRAKFIAEKYLSDVKLVNSVRGILTYTGYYNGKEVSVMASGIGMASIGIYCYELYKFYDVDTIIRIGSCGAYKKELDLFDLVLTTTAVTNSNFAYLQNGEECYSVDADKKINELIINKAKEKGLKLWTGKTNTSLVFDAYASNQETLLKGIGEDVIASEMEAFALIYIANMFDKKATCVTTVSDNQFLNKIATPAEREKSFKNMIELVLDAL